MSVTLRKETPASYALKVWRSADDSGGNSAQIMAAPGRRKRRADDWPRCYALGNKCVYGDVYWRDGITPYTPQRGYRRPRAAAGPAAASR